MCKLCNGTYVDKGGSGSLRFVQPCPNCGPMPEAVWEKRRADFRKRFEEAKRQAALAGKEVS
ncbi:hypothetical protein [Pseudobacillus badius]|uniref:hypothetical protein n=1 Tax=Bacillus badius TaxID=1455 RepID=UPI0024A1B90D|nr:hypothetical protein [Bacillus badius]GLY10357.1 hypothetical protein Bbad01_15730 [Bacillus badius]